MSDLKKWYLGGMVEAMDSGTSEGAKKAWIKRHQNMTASERAKAWVKLRNEDLSSLNDSHNRDMANYYELMLNGRRVDSEEQHKKNADKMTELANKLHKSGISINRHGYGPLFTFRGKSGIEHELDGWKNYKEIVAKDDSEFEQKHERGNDGRFVKKGEGGGLAALEEVYRKGGFKHPEALAKADFEELGKMDDSRLDAEITMLNGKVEEGGKPLDKARLEVAKGIMDGRGGKKVDTNGKIEGNGEESLKKTNSELYSLISQDAGKFDELESEAMKSVGKNMEAYMTAKKSGDSDLAKKKMELAKAGERVTERFAMIRQLHSLKATADRFHVDGNTYMEDVYRKHTDKYRKRFEEQFGEI